MTRNYLLLTTMFVVQIATSVQARADKIMGLNFTETPATALAGKTADGLSNWTDGGLTGSGLVLAGSNGLVSCDWLAPLWWRSGDTDTPDEQLYYSYLEDSSDGPQITLTGLAYWLAAEGSQGYTIRIYQNDNHAGSTFSPVYVYPDTMTLRQDQETMVRLTNIWTWYRRTTCGEPMVERVRMSIRTC